MENTTWNIIGTSIVMEYAMRNIVGTLIIYEIQASFRPAGGVGFEAGLQKILNWLGTDQKWLLSAVSRIIKTSSSKARGRCYTVYCLLSTVDVY